MRCLQSRTAKATPGDVPLSGIRTSALGRKRTVERAFDGRGPLPAIPQPRRHPVDGQVYRPPRPLIGIPSPIAPQQLHLQMI